MTCPIKPRELWTWKNVEKKASHIIVKRGKETSKGKYVASTYTTGKMLASRRRAVATAYYLPPWMTPHYYKSHHDEH
eukprot:scaffold5665_cov92-Skeletonema_dohrnii-CCMP3373.AAC.5